MLGHWLALDGRCGGVNGAFAIFPLRACAVFKGSIGSERMFVRGMIGLASH